MLRMRFPRDAVPERATHWPALLAVGLTIGLGGCKGLVDVGNPNVVAQEDVEKPATASALANGALQNTARAQAWYQLVSETISDHIVWLGTFDNVGELDRGQLRATGGQYSGPNYETAGVARWMSDEAVRILEELDAAGTLKDRNDLARAYFYSAVNYASAADMFEDFVLSDRQKVSPPIGGAQMSTLYDIALERLGKASAIAEATRNTDLQNTVLGWRARVYWAKALWQKLRPRTTPSDPLIDDTQASTAARTLLARAPADWKVQFGFNAATGTSTAGFQVNSRREVTFDRSLADLDPSGRAICSPFNATCTRDGIRVLDPIDRIQDPALRRFLWEFIRALEYPPVTIISSRELRLILAEGALKRGDMGEFLTQINAVRALEVGLSPYDPAVHTTVTPLQLLIHERNVNLILQPHRRLGDMYRFGIRAPRWADDGEAVRAPGTVMPLSRTELQSNCYISGACR